jgi:hypothetical protein
MLRYAALRKNMFMRYAALHTITILRCVTEIDD